MNEYRPAETLKDLIQVFDQHWEIEAGSPFYAPRSDERLQRLSFDLCEGRARLHAFVCGHRGSGKTTELKRLIADPQITARYLPLYLTARAFTNEIVHLTHDAILVEIGLSLAEAGERHGMAPALQRELSEWGKTTVQTYLHNETASAEVGAKGSAWLAFFRAQLATRRQWSDEQKQILEPRVDDLVDIVNRMARDIENRTHKQVLVILDDLEKGESDAHRQMHARIFDEHYETLIRPQIAIVYVLPVYFRARLDRRIPPGQIYSFPAIRLYQRGDKSQDRPQLGGEGLTLLREFVRRRVVALDRLFAAETLDELLLIGGGLFRETARVVSDAAYSAYSRGHQQIEPDDVDRVFHQVKKEYQPLIRGAALPVLAAVLASEQGWVDGVEPYLQSRAVVEYENRDLWLDVRYPLKPYLRGLGRAG